MRPHREGEDGGPSRKESRLRRTPKGRSSDPNRFSGSGIQFKAKIIGTERVLDARGNRMCQGALQRLKAAVKTSGDHKQRIILNVSLNGIVIKDEKSGEILHHHPIHKISFISQDTGDNRAFGYVFGCPQTGHDFFGVKTEKMASQVVLTLRDLFLAALELKKKEMEEEEEVPAAEVSSESGASSERTVAHNCQRTESIMSEELPHSDKPPDESNATSAENMLLKYSVDSLQQGISHMDRSIARGFGFSFSEDDVSESSVNSIPASFQFKMDKLASLYHETMSLSSRSSSTSEYACATEFQDEDRRDVGVSSEPTSEDASSPRREDKYAVFLEDIDALPSVFDNPDIMLQPIVTPRPKTPVEEDHKETSDAPSSAPVAFAELDPLGSQPYVDRKDFFHELKKPPKKALKDLTDSAELFSSRLSVDFCNNSENGLPKGSPFHAFNVPPPPFNPFADPPSLPPKRPPPFPDPSEEVPWGHRSPFNPFVSDECLDVPPPSSPPPPPPPRLPSKAAAPCTPTPPPRPPGRPSAPLPAWLSFDQEEGPPAPPLPSPARKFSQTDTPPCSPKWNSNTVASSHSEVNAAEVFFPEIVGDSPRFERWGSKQPSDSMERGFSRNGESFHQPPENSTMGISQNGGGLPPGGAASPPLPPKPGRSDASSTSLASVSSNGTHSSSSFVFSSSDESRRAGSGGEPLMSSGEHALSPDSIFRRKDDPFADDFFLSLPKKTNDRACFRDFKPPA